MVSLHDFELRMYLVFALIVIVICVTCGCLTLRCFDLGVRFRFVTCNDWLLSIWINSVVVVGRD